MAMERGRSAFESSNLFPRNLSFKKKSLIRHVVQKIIEAAGVAKWSKVLGSGPSLLVSSRVQIPSPALDNEIIVKKSRIEGKGVFASRDFKKGEVVIKWDISHELRPEELKGLPEKEKRYVTNIGGKIILMQPPARYVNHSCDANTHAHNFCDVATRDIKKGEEITANYSETMGPDESMECNCGGKNCRRLIQANFKNKK